MSEVRSDAMSAFSEEIADKQGPLFALRVVVLIERLLMQKANAP
jgi:hypothetical protein